MPVTTGGEPLVVVDGVAKRYTADLDLSLRHGAADIVLGWRQRPGDPVELREEEFWAVQGVSFRAGPGEAVGVIGRNGAGKSTLLRIVAGITKPDRGVVQVQGRVGALLDPSANLDPLLTGRENCRASAAYAGVPRREIADRIDVALDFADIGEFADAPVRHYSQGMRMRLGYSIIAAVAPDVLLIDEALAVGDVAFRRKCAEHIQRHLHGGGIMVLVSHSVFAVQALCQHALVLDRGEVTFAGATAAAVDTYLGTTAGMPDGAHEPALTGSPASKAGAAKAADGPHRVAAVTLDQPTPDLVSGRPTTLRVEVDSAAAVEAVDWAFMVWTGDQQTSVTGAVFADRGFRLEAGRSTLAADIGPLPLEPGTYALKVAVLEPGSGIPLVLHGWAGDATIVHVEAPPEAAADPLHALSGQPLVSLDLDWRPPTTLP